MNIIEIQIGKAKYSKSFSKNDSFLDVIDFISNISILNKSESPVVILNGEKNKFLDIKKLDVENQFRNLVANYAFKQIWSDDKEAIKTKYKLVLEGWNENMSIDFVNEDILLQLIKNDTEIAAKYFLYL